MNALSDQLKVASLDVLCTLSKCIGKSTCFSKTGNIKYYSFTPGYSAAMESHQKHLLRLRGAEELVIFDRRLFRSSIRHDIILIQVHQY